jgi:AraC-like DNA-binding protein
VVQGEVHDENAFAMGGASGHAGLFAAADDVLRVVVDGAFEGVIRSEGRELPFRTSPGFVSLHTGRTTGTVRVEGSARTLVVGLPPEWLERFWREGPPSQAGVCRVPGRHETARLLALAMCEEVLQGSQSGSLFAQSLSTALLSYVLDRLPVQALNVRGALSEAQCRRLTRHVEERLGEDLQLTELAQLCGVGLRHFSSLFRNAYGMTPHRFVVSRRLERGAALLSTSNLDIAEVALVVGFSSQSHFTTAFRRQHGVTPASYRSQERRCVGVFRKSKPGFRPEQYRRGNRQ